MEKSGFDATARFRHAASSDGKRVSFTINGVAAGAHAGVPSTFVAARDASRGWLPGSPMDSPTISAFGTVPVFTGFSDDMSVGMLTAFGKLTPEATEGLTQLYVRDTSAGTYRLLTPTPAPLNSFGVPDPQAFRGPVAQTPDARHLVYESGVQVPGGLPQTADSITGEINSYEWADGNVRLVGVLPDGSAAVNGSLPGSGHLGHTLHSLSADGSRIVFHATTPDQAAEQATASTSGQLYVRQAGASTVHASASQRTDCAGDPTCGGDDQPDPAPDPAGPLPAFFWDAEVEQGDAVLFTSCEQLTDDSTAEASADPRCGRGDRGADPHIPGADLYRFDVDSGMLTDLTTGDPAGADVFGVVGSSEDLSRVYFVAGGVLATGATADAPNLYVRDGGATRFIGTLDSACSNPGSPNPIQDCESWYSQASLDDRVAGVAPDGEHALIASRAPLTGYDNSNPRCVGGRCSEVFLYTAGADSLSCISCSDLSASGDARLNRGAASVSSLYDPPARNLAADGSFAFFETPDRLLPSEDSNSSYDVYEWREGGWSMVSGGRGSDDSLFVDASEGGQDAFLLTRDRLVGTDVDDLVDMYDARVGGGFPEPPPPALGCQADACQGALSSVPTRGDPASSEFVGPGDVRQPTPLRVAGVTLEQRRTFARTGLLKLKVTIYKPGTIVVRSRQIARPVKVVAGRRGTLRLGVRLSKRSKRILHRSGRLGVALLVRSGSNTRSMHLTLRRAK